MSKYRKTAYEFYCFDGKIKFFGVYLGPNNRRSVAFYDTEWNLLPFKIGKTPQAEEVIEMPKSLEKMLSIAQTLYEGFIHVRVDLNLINDFIIKFGEMTFTSGSGAQKWDPPSANVVIGRMLDLTELMKKRIAMEKSQP